MLGWLWFLTIQVMFSLHPPNPNASSDQVSLITSEPHRSPWDTVPVLMLLSEAGWNFLLSCTYSWMQERSHSSSSVPQKFHPFLLHFWTRHEKSLSKPGFRETKNWARCWTWWIKWTVVVILGRQHLCVLEWCPDERGKHLTAVASSFGPFKKLCVGFLLLNPVLHYYTLNIKENI